MLYSLISLTSHAKQSGQDFFIKVELGQNLAKTSELSMQLPEGAITQVDDSATGWTFGLGMNVTPKFSVTLGYVDMGEGGLIITGDTLNAPEYYQSVSQVTPVLVSGVTLDGRYHFLRDEQYSVAGFFGLLAWNSDVASTYTEQHLEHEQEGVDIFYGIEGTYHLNKTWDVNMGIKRYALDVNNIDAVYLGFAYHF